MVKHLNISISGRVQGVAFRFSAKQKAEELDISGFAKNNPDRSVYIEVEGEEKTLDEFIKWCRGGPLFAKVDDIKVEEGKVKNSEGFEII